MFPLGIASRGSFRRQIILTFVLGFFLLISPFAVYMVQNENSYLHRDSREDTATLAELLASGSRSWVLANDVVGLQEVVHSLLSHPQLRYAMIISPSGLVLAHTDETKVGQFVSDERSLALLKSPPAKQVMMDSESLEDVAMPILVQNRHIGWARVVQSREKENGNLRTMVWNSALFVLLATTLSLLAAMLIANRLGEHIGSLVRVAKQVQAGNFSVRASVPGSTGEIVQLGDSLNQMLDALERNQMELRAASLYTRSLIEASLDPLVTISPEGKITDVNEATEKATGRSRAELIDTDFSDYFTEPDKARAGYQKVFLQGSVVDYPLTLRHRDGRIMDVLYNASVYRKGSGEVLGVFAAARDITERKQAEEELRRSEEVLKEAQRIAHLGSWHMDLATNEVFWSEELYKMYGFDPALPPPLYTESMKLFTPESWERLSTAIAQAAEKGIPYELELEMVRINGNRGWMLARGEQVRDGRGAAVRVRGVAMDITERKRADEALRENEHFLNSLIEHLPNMLFVKDAKDLKFIRFNKAGEVLLGYARNELIGKSDYDFFPKEQADFFISKDREIIARGEMQDIPEEPISTKYLGQRYLHTRKIPIISDDGVPLYLLGISEDITERKQAEEQLRRSEQGLSEAQRIAHLGNWELDLVSNVLTWSDEIYRIFEIDPEKFGASYAAFLDAIHPEDRDMVNNAYTESVKSKTPYNIEHRLLMKDGRIKFVNEKCETHYGEDGKPLRSVGTVHDITERKMAENKIQELNRNLEQRVVERTAQLEAANKELEAFSYSVSHDLRTPLRAIDGFSHILLDDYTDKLDDEGKRLLNVVRDNTAKMGQLIDDILKFSRAGRLEITFSEIDMESMAREVYEELRPAAGHEFQMEIGHLPMAMGDRAMLRQVWVNLLSNAIKFTRAREGAKIEVGSSAGENETVYFVKDNGAGFDMKYADRLFGVFQRLHTASEFEGTGIGLAIVKRIVNRHGGRVWAEGKINEGATLYFTLPNKEQEHE